MTTPTTPTTASGSITAETRYDSAWSPSALHVTAPDATKPPAPSAPQSARSGGTLRVRADGLGRFGETMPADVLRGGVFEVHISTSAVYTPTSPAQRAAAGFDLSTDTLRAELAVGITGTITGLSTSATYYVVLVARDTSGNRSDASPAVDV